MALDERYMTSLSLQEIFADKDTGLLLAGGTVEFFCDDNRNNHKLVFELTGAPPNYAYSALPTTMTLGTAGQFVDPDGNDIKVYYYPYDDNGDIELYYIEVRNSEGTLQFTREGFPNLSSGNDPTADGDAKSNMLVNPQFADINFNATDGLTINYSGSTTTEVDIAPGWTLSIAHTGSGTATVTRTALAANANNVTNPPYALTLTPGTNVSGFYLYQRLSNDPGIWSSKSATVPFYIASSVTTNSPTSLSVYYSPSGAGTEVLLDTINNVSGLYQEDKATTLIDPADSTSTGETGYVDIQLRLATGAASTVTSVQALGTYSDDENVRYEQLPVNMQKSNLFYYYNPILQEKPIPSWLVGWDFPLNPAQWGSAYGAAAIGIGKSAYVWDQTIVYQGTDSGFSASRDASGALKLTVAKNNTALALVQYIEQSVARDILSNRMSVHVAAKMANGADVPFQVGIYYTTDAMLPDIKAANYLSLVSNVAADGTITAGNGNWTAVGRSNLGIAKGTLTTNAANEFNEYKFKGWDADGAAYVESATYVAIVFAIGEMSAGDIVDIKSISLCSGDIPTRPAAQTLGQVLEECQRYWEQSYRSGVAAGTVTNDNALIKAQSAFLTGTTYTMATDGFSIEFRNEKYWNAPTVTIYNPVSGGSASVRGFVWGKGSASAGSGNIAMGSIWSASADTKGVTYDLAGYDESITEGSGAAGGWAGGYIKLHYTVDSRLGVVNVQD